MQVLPTVLLQHVTRAGRHFDWMLADPKEPSGPLATFRVRAASAVWASSGCWDLEPIAPHRRGYLVYEGPVARGRGQVRRVDEGTFVPALWTATRSVIALTLRRFTGTVEFRRVSDTLWRARWLAPRDDADEFDTAVPFGRTAGLRYHR